MKRSEEEFYTTAAARNRSHHHCKSSRRCCSVKVQENYAETIKQLKDEVRSLLMSEENNTTIEKITLIDTIERLGVGYHFEEEIEKHLEQIYKYHHLNSQEYDLFTTALQFRLLRQHRYNIPCDVFDKFKDKSNDDKFDEKFTSDAKGLLCLYQAAHLRMHGENVLEEALAFTTHHLNRMLPQLVSPLQDEVKQALEQPVHKGIPRMEARKYISIYEINHDAKNDMILKLAKLDFNFLQNLYKKELILLMRWWNNFGLKSKVSYSRERIMESYLWGVTCRFEPQYSYVRIAYAKCVEVLTKINDIYDNYATVEEAKLFTDIFQRWDINEIDKLPTDCMRVIQGCTLDLYEVYERDSVEQEKIFAVPYAIEAVKQVCRAFYKKMKWFMERQMPTFDEYISNSWLTSSIYVFYTFIIPGMKSVTKENVDWLTSDEPSRLIVGASNIVRYLNDVTSYERETREGKMPTGIECYMKHYGVSKQEAMEKFIDAADDGWKDVNTEWINSTNNNSIPKDYFEGVFNYARAGEVLYKKSDCYTDPEMLAPQLIALFVDPIIIS
ncbi:hypothetical protein RD792_013096 [Penstemon davidsonii]|uniref:Uncharacterized protein n=1 Tax=Penstemon davidsonii TaxID=160366 RepID=A0ABR0CSL5_9LAMI|nr:hypothetical protein RD792_013096 [Penstemon davidsonii]